MRGRKISLILGAAVVAIGVGAWVVRGNSDVQYRTAPAERGDIAYTISAKWGYLEHDWTATAGDFI